MADITYILNDPTTKNLTKPVDLPEKPGVLDFKVAGYRGATPTMYTLEHQAACCHYSIVQGINLFNKNLIQPVNKWSSTKLLRVHPRAGKQLNAYYDRHNLKFFYSNDPVAKKMVFTANSSDVVLHELGHAILDAIRPDLFNTQAMEVWGFHESFGDIFAIINALQHEEILDYMMNETNGDLRKTNVVTKVGEEIGTAIYNTTGGRMGHTVGSLRNAVNDYKYVPPETLPRNGKHNQLTSECHSFSRVFTGAWYDILVGIYEHEKKDMAPKDALIKARNVLTKYTFRSLRSAPKTIRFYDAVAKSMLVVDKANKYKYNQIMNQAFIQRNILRQAVKPFVALNWDAFESTLEPEADVFEDSAVKTVTNKKTELLNLTDYMLNVEAPADSYYEFDDVGNCVEMIEAGPHELIEHAHLCVEFLKEKDMIRPDRMAPFEIDSEGNLIRSHFSICFNTNSTDPGQPEFNKQFKSANNSGCGCNAQPAKKCTDVQANITQLSIKNCTNTSVLNARVIQQRNTR